MKKRPEEALTSIFRLEQFAVQAGPRSFCGRRIGAMRKEIVRFCADPELGSQHHRAAQTSRHGINGTGWSCTGLGRVGGRRPSSLSRNFTRHAPVVPPVITFGSGAEFTRAAALTGFRMSPVRYVQSRERLLDETAVLLHCRRKSSAYAEENAVPDYGRCDHTLAGRKILVVDDDLRNIFAFTSVLEHEMTVMHAETGRAGIEAAAKSGYRSGSDGHHDAGDGRL